MMQYTTLSRLMKNILVLVSVWLFLSCNNTPAKKQSASTRADLFREFIKKFKPAELPFVYRYVNYTENFDLDKMSALDIQSGDTIFVNTDYPQGVKCFGILPDTSSFFSLIYFYPADSYYPQLVTYDKNGKIIDETSLIVNGCGSDCGLHSCSETGIIHKDLSIFCADTSVWEYFCDSLGEPIPNSAAIWIDTKSGTLGKNGKFRMSEDKHEEKKHNLPIIPKTD